MSTTDVTPSSAPAASRAVIPAAAAYGKGLAVGEGHGRRVHLISLGCSRNRVDAEVMLGGMITKGWRVTDDAASADAIVVNTCGFIGSAKEESIDTILTATELKKDKKDLKVVVTGCLTQRYKSQLAKGLPEVDLFVGTDEFSRLADLLEQPVDAGSVFAKRTHYLYSADLPRVNTLAKHSAYVKVAEGCQHNCAFCIIPAIRGRLRSRPIDSVVREAEGLVAQGVVEINLIAQDLAAYGRDWPENKAAGTSQLLDLLKALVAVEGLRWIRCLYIYPEHVSDEFLELFATQPKIVKYLDIPVQHASDPILKAMKRDVTRDTLRSTIARVRARVPDVAIRTSVMVGFPGETEADVETLIDFVREARFEHLGCFAYSQEEGTVAARMPDQIDDAVKQERLARVMAAQQEVSRSRLTRYVGKEVDVLVEGPSAESDLLWQGRLSTQAPEVDGVVYLTDGPVRAGAIQKVKVTDSSAYDLVGEVLA
jgi:ribosomal protein S12 methylthiotransferase